MIIQRRYFARPKRGLEALAQPSLFFSKEEIGLAKQDWEKIQQQDFSLIPWGHPHYPILLKEIYDPPLVLLARGKTETFNQHPWVAVVGARKVSQWGREKTNEMVASLIKRGFGIVSGLAYGIDGQAHQAALEAGGITWGVLGSGLDCLYPARHISLARQMEKAGGILSEFPLGCGPQPYHFPQRNRIISGLSQAVVIVEASAKSGSRITARYALEQGREVLVVPPPDREDIRYAGNIALLEEGAQPIGGEYHPRPVCTSQTVSHWLLPFLNRPAALEALIQQTQKPPQEILAELTLLESIGKVKKHPGPLWQSL